MQIRDFKMNSDGFNYLLLSMPGITTMVTFFSVVIFNFILFGMLLAMNKLDYNKVVQKTKGNNNDIFTSSVHTAIKTLKRALCFDMFTKPFWATEVPSAAKT